MKIIIGGASGFIGRALAADLADDGHEVIALVRRQEEIPVSTSISWDGRSLGDWAKQVDGADVVVNLAGAPISMKWSPENRRIILESRISSARVLAEAIGESRRPPRVYLAGSAVGFYGDTGDRLIDERDPAAEGFLGEVCSQWEQAAQTDRCRLVYLRTGIALGRGGGMLPTLLSLTKAFVGGAVGNGRQYIPWIHIEDHVRMMRWAMVSNIEGPVNLCAPRPVPNAELMEVLRSVMNRPWSPPAPTFALKLFGALGGPDPSLALMSSRVVPRIAQERGFQWRWPELEPALRDLVEN